MEQNPIPGPKEQISSLIGEVRDLAQAELDYAKARLGYSGGIIRKAGMLAVAALLLASGAAIALVLGLLMIVASYSGPWLATILVVALFGASAWIAAIMARRTARNLSFTSEAENGEG